jgi:hypothetical protein
MPFRSFDRSLHRLRSSPLGRQRSAPLLRTATTDARRLSPVTSNRRHSSNSSKAHTETGEELGTWKKSQRGVHLRPSADAFGVSATQLSARCDHSIVPSNSIHDGIGSSAGNGAERAEQVDAHYGTIRVPSSGRRPAKRGYGQPLSFQSTRHAIRHDLTGLQRNHTGQSRQFSSTSVAMDNDPQPLSEVIPAQGRMPEVEIPLHVPIRERLRLWQKENSHSPEVEMTIPPGMENGVGMGGGFGGPEEIRRRDEHEDRDYSNMPQSFEDESAEDDDLITPGTLVEIQSKSSGFIDPILAVVLRQIGTEFQCYTIKGKWIGAHRKAVHWALPNFVSPEKVAKVAEFVPIRLDEHEWDETQLQDRTVPRSIGGPFISQMQSFVAQCEQVYRENTTSLDNCYELLADKTRLRFGTLERITKTLLHFIANRQGRDIDVTKEVTDAEIWAVRKAIITKGGIGFGFQLWGSSRSMVYQIRPKEQVQQLEKVVSWTREYQEAQVAQLLSNEHLNDAPASQFPGAQIIEDFATKTRALVDYSRSYRKESYEGRVGPSQTQYALTDKQGAIRIEQKTEFSANDLMIIRFLELWSFTAELQKDIKFHTVGATVLRAIGRYADYRDRTAGALFLQESGAVPSYVNPQLYSEHLMLPAMNISKQLNELSRRANELRKDDGAKLHDSLQSIRKDWGQMPVFCIDGEGAEEIDDGVSVERIPGNSSEYWIHVHIANPTAFLPREHLLSKLAAHMTASVYLPEATFPMLPKWATQKYFSLAPDRPVLTFSTRLDKGGNALETKIQPGFIRNVISITPEQARQALGIPGETRPRTLLQVGGPWPKSEERRSPVPPELKEDLALLYEAALNRFHIRTKKGLSRNPLRNPEVTVRGSLDRPGLPLSLRERTHARFVVGDPAIQVDFFPADHTITSLSDHGVLLVQELMILAGETAARWARDNQIGFLYRGTRKYVNLDDETFYRDFYDKTLDEDGIASPYMQKLEAIQRGRSFVSTAYHPHAFLGVDGYAKITSPLRRYNDMVNHWQLESFLLKQAFPDKDVPEPFTKEGLEQIALRLEPRERLIQRTNSISSRIWTNMALQRALYHGEGSPLPDEFTVYVDTAAATGAGSFSQGIFHGYIQELGLRVWIATPAKGAVRVGDVWTCKWSVVDGASKMVKVDALHLTSRNEEHSEIYESYIG